VNPVSFAIISIGIVLSAIGQLLLKAGANHLHALALTWSSPVQSFFSVLLERHVFFGLTCFVVSAAVWLVALSRVAVSVAYPMLSLGYAINAVAAYYLFDEALSRTKIAGIGVIMLGVLLISKS
jgi:multidrug transporter EmrE-like cation transporter